jgi:hypothetical protein
MGKGALNNIHPHELLVQTLNRILACGLGILAVELPGKSARRYLPEAVLERRNPR